MQTCLYINNTRRPDKLGGGARCLLGILKELPAHGWERQVVAPSEGQFTDAVRTMDIPCRVYPFASVDARRPLASCRGLLTWRRIMRDVRPAIVHANSFELSRSFGPAARSLGLPFISHVHFPAEPAGIRWVLRGLAKPDAFIFASHAIKDALWSEIVREAPQSRCYVVHNAVDLEDFTPAPWPEAPPYRVGIVANFAPFKRHEDFLCMAAEIVRERDDIEFWIVGDDTQGEDRREMLENLARELGVLPYTRFLGYRSDIAVIMAQLHVLVVTSKFENFPLVVLEAMARGRPVVGSRDGGLPESIGHGETGYLVEVGDCAGFARAVLALISDRDRWDAMGRRAAEVARMRFSIAAHVARIVEIYCDVIHPSSAR